jgi:two-component sensor histidine kinase
MNDLGANSQGLLMEAHEAIYPEPQGENRISVGGPVNDRRHQGIEDWPIWQAVLVGACVFALCMGARAEVDHVIPGRLVLFTFIPGVIVATYVAGAAAGAVVLGGGLIFYYLWDVQLQDSGPILGITRPSLYVLAGGLTIFVLTSVRRAHSRLAHANLRLTEQEDRLRLINQELMHRNRNLFSVFATLTAHTMKSRGINEEVTAVLNRRIAALARAQSLLTLKEGNGLPLQRLVEQALEPLVPEASRLELEGPLVDIPSSRVSGFALVLHELGTNAIKYGAWSNSSGLVTVRWSAIRSGVSIIWREEGGPPAPSGAKPGLGSVLIETAVPQVKLERSFTTAGARIVLHVPLAADANGDPVHERGARLECLRNEGKGDEIRLRHGRPVPSQRSKHTTKNGAPLQPAHDSRGDND